jgi:hypothetical protein
LWCHGFRKPGTAGQYGTEEVEPFLKKEDPIPNAITNEIELYGLVPLKHTKEFGAWNLYKTTI